MDPSFEFGKIIFTISLEKSKISTFPSFLHSRSAPSRFQSLLLLSKSVAKARRYPTYDTRKENDNIYGSSNPLFPPEALFPFHSKSLRHRSKGDLSSAARPPCTMHASRSEENRIPAQTGTFRAVFASRPQQPPFPLSHTLHVSCAFEYDQRELT